MKTPGFILGCLFIAVSVASAQIVATSEFANGVNGFSGAQTIGSGISVDDGDVLVVLFGSEAGQVSGFTYNSLAMTFNANNIADSIPGQTAIGYFVNTSGSTITSDITTSSSGNANVAWEIFTLSGVDTSNPFVGYNGFNDPGNPSGNPYIFSATVSGATVGDYGLSVAMLGSGNIELTAAAPLAETNEFDPGGGGGATVAFAGGAATAAGDYTGQWSFNNGGSVFRAGTSLAVFNAIPEPSTALLAGLGGLALVAARRRRRR